MKRTEKVLFGWSGGKDSALAMHVVRLQGELEVAALLTTITADYGRVSMHGVRRELLAMQAGAIGTPLEEVFIPADASHDLYASRMRDVLQRYKAGGVSAVVFGDLLLEDVRRYREEKLAEVDMRAIFPLWGRDTGELAREFIDLGFRAIITCVDTEQLDGRFAGREFDAALLADLPAGVDPMGENGEFHTFVYDGPIFSRPVACRTGEVVVRESRFYFCDVIPQVCKQGIANVD
jgi:uncharacterized protein (TIGR00290 family)